MLKRHSMARPGHHPPPQLQHLRHHQPPPRLRACWPRGFRVSLMHREIVKKPCIFLAKLGHPKIKCLVCIHLVSHEWNITPSCFSGTSALRLESISGESMYSMLARTYINFGILTRTPVIIGPNVPTKNVILQFCCNFEAKEDTKKKKKKKSNFLLGRFAQK